MISRIGSQGYTQSSSRIQKAGAEPRPQNAREPATKPTTQSAAVVRISSDARALASQSEGVEKQGQSADARAKIDIEPVVAQPVPDFNASKAEASQSADKAPTKEYQAPTTDSRVA
jgi:hypothetical protein